MFCNDAGKERGEQDVYQLPACSPGDIFPCEVEPFMPEAGNRLVLKVWIQGVKRASEIGSILAVQSFELPGVV